MPAGWSGGGAAGGRTSKTTAPLGSSGIIFCSGASIEASKARPGGKAYGYAPAVGEKGKRIIVEAEAKIVQRIFEEYVAGRTPREIAYDLNNENISPPRGRS